MTSFITNLIFLQLDTNPVCSQGQNSDKRRVIQWDGIGCFSTTVSRRPRPSPDTGPWWECNTELRSWASVMQKCMHIYHRYLFIMCSSRESKLWDGIIYEVWPRNRGQSSESLRSMLEIQALLLSPLITPQNVERSQFMAFSKAKCIAAITHFPLRP